SHSLLHRRLMRKQRRGVSIIAKPQKYEIESRLIRMQSIGQLFRYRLLILGRAFLRRPIRGNRMNAVWWDRHMFEKRSRRHRKITSWIVAGHHAFVTEEN